MTDKLKSAVEQCVTSVDYTLIEAIGEVTLEVAADDVHNVLKTLKEDKHLDFNILIDVCGVDYATFGESEWETETVTFQGFSRGVDTVDSAGVAPKLACVYHLLSTTHNWRIRVRTFCAADMPVVKTVSDLWPAADWFEREAYDLYGILFQGHADLRRILTDYGFIGHPFRKSFPVSGHVEMRYDAEAERVIYEPVDIEPRILVPRVVRDDSRYEEESAS